MCKAPAEEVGGLGEEKWVGGWVGGWRRRRLCEWVCMDEKKAVRVRCAMWVGKTDGRTFSPPPSSSFWKAHVSKRKGRGVEPLPPPLPKLVEMA